MHCASFSLHKVFEKVLVHFEFSYSNVVLLCSCEHSCQSEFEVILFDQCLFMSIIIVDIFVLSLINARCFGMYLLLGFHFFKFDAIGHCFCIGIHFLFYWVRVSAWTFLGNIYNFSFGFPHLPTLSFCRTPHFLIFNNLYKRSNRLSSWGICHGRYFGSDIASKIKCNNVFLSCIQL